MVDNHDNDEYITLVIKAMPVPVPDSISLDGFPRTIERDGRVYKLNIYTRCYETSFYENRKLSKKEKEEYDNLEELGL